MGANISNALNNPSNMVPTDAKIPTIGGSKYKFNRSAQSGFGVEQSVKTFYNIIWAVKMAPKKLESQPNGTDQHCAHIMRKRTGN